VLTGTAADTSFVLVGVTWTPPPDTVLLVLLLSAEGAAVLSVGAGGGFQGSMALNGGSTPVAVEDAGVVLYLSTQCDACVSDDGSQVLDFGMLSDGLGPPVAALAAAPVSSNHSQVV